MDDSSWIPLVLAFVAFMYASVGHAGASGYAAVFALAAMPVAETRSQALLMNMGVAALAWREFRAAGFFKHAWLLPLAGLSVPFALIGGVVPLSPRGLKLFLGVILLFSAVWLSLGGFRERLEAHREMHGMRTPKVWHLCLTGAMLGLLSGLSGTGGGIFLTPLLLLARWASLKEAGGIAAPFILLNSLAGLLGNVWAKGSLPSVQWTWLVVALVFGWLGARWGSLWASVSVLRIVLACIMFLAAGKFLLG